MKSIIVFVALFALTLAAPDKHAETLHYEANVEPKGFSYAIETSDGKVAQEQGVIKNEGSEHEAISVQGSYSYVGDDGHTYQVSYIADENGFQPQGAHIPVAH